MSEFVEQPIKKLMNEENPISRIERVEELTGAFPSATVNSMDEVANDMGIFGGGSNELVFTPEGVESVLPTSTDFTGTFLSGDGYEFNSELYNIGGVNEGVLQWGARQDNGKITAGEGAVTLDNNGITIQQGSGSVNAIKWDGSLGTSQFNIYARELGTSANAFIDAVADSTGSVTDSSLLISARDRVGSGPYISLTSINGGAKTIDLDNGAVIINVSQADTDTTIKSANNANMLVVDAGLDAVGVAGAAESGYELKVTGELKVTERITSSGFLNIPSSGDLTINAGVITATGSAHRVDTQGGAATDDLDTINGGSDGDILILQTVSSARDVTVKDATGNLRLAGDFVMTNVNDRLMLRLSGSNWVELCRSDND